MTHSLKNGLKLLPHQEKVLMWMTNRARDRRISGGIISLELGLGKTLCASEWILNNCTKTALIICSRTLVYEWIAHFEKFYEQSEVQYIVYHKDYMAGDRMECINSEFLENYKFVLTTYDVIMSIDRKGKYSESQEVLNANRTVAGYKCSQDTPEYIWKELTGPRLIATFPWDSIVADESARFSNPKTATYKSIMALYGKTKWCLTGIPIKNSCTDLYSQLRFCGYDEIYSKNFKLSTYRRENLDRCVIRLDYEGAGIPKPVVEIHQVNLELTGREKEIYNHYLEAAKNAYNGYVAGVRAFVFVLVMFLRLRQVAICPYTALAESARKSGKLDPEYVEAQKTIDKNTKGLSGWIRDVEGTSGKKSAKVTKAVEIIKTVVEKGEKILVFSMFKRVNDIIMLVLDDNGMKDSYDFIDGDVTGDERSDALNGFKTNDEKKVLFMTFKTGSEGLNITIANNVLLLDSWWNNALINQGIGRTARIGQTKVVHVYKLTTENTIEQRMNMMCQDKDDIVASFLDSGGSVKSKNGGINARMLGQILY